MVWYKKYLSIYEKPFSEVPAPMVQEIKEKLAIKQCKEPLVSVIAIAHNEEQRILSCLWSLANNSCKDPIEIFVVNNNSTDRTTEVLDAIGIPWLDEKKKGPGFARQCGLDHAKGKYHLCIDSDTMYPPHYIETMVNALKQEDVVAVYGLWSFIADENHPKTGLFFYELLRDIHLRIQNIKRPELCVRGMVMGFRTEEGRKYGFRKDIIRGEDGSLALNLKKDGKLHFLTSRKVRALTGNGTLNADGSLLKSFIARGKKAFHGLSGLFTKQDKYDDGDANLIK